MTRERIDAIARRFITAWSAGGEDVVDELADPDIVVSYSHFPEPVRGAEAFKAVLRETASYFPDLRTEAEDVLVDGDRAVVRWTYAGAHRRGELFGVEASGRQVRVPGITIFRIAGSRVVEETGVVDSMALMAQVTAGRDEAARDG